MDGFTYISSKDNQYFKLASKLQKSSKERKNEGKFVLEGLRICNDAYENNISFFAVFATEDFIKKFPKEAEKLGSVSENKFTVPISLFEKLCETKSPQGILAVAIIPELSGNIFGNKKYIALDNLNDPSNLGAISRTAEALGISGIIMTDDSCDPYSPKSIRASMGTLLRMPIVITSDLSKTIKENGLRSFSCVVDKEAKDIGSVSFKNGDVIIIGNEANGVSEAVKKNSDFLITIPMKGKAESLNAAAAAAIALFQLSK